MASTVASTDAQLDVYRQVLYCYTQKPVDAEGFDAEQIALIRRFSKPKCLLYLAFPPKCGGTFLREAIGRYMALRGLFNGKPKLLRGSFVGDGGQERDLYFPELFGFFFGGEEDFGLIHNHPTATSGNLGLLDLFGIRPVVMLRSIPDMLKSIYDVSCKTGIMGDFGSSAAEDETHAEQPLEVQKDFLIYNVAPWYVKFYATWLLAERRGHVRFHPVQFDQFRQSPEAAVASILTFYGIDVADDDLEQAVALANAQKPQLRFNRGVSGRGHEFFDERHHRHLGRLVQSYQGIDFASLGLI